MRERWQELDGRATPGPWVTQPFPRSNWVRQAGPQVDAIGIAGRRMDMDDVVFTGQTSSIPRGQWEADAEFIAVARTAWPAAERECEQLRTQNERLRKLLGQVRGRVAVIPADYENTVRIIDRELAVINESGLQRSG